MSINKYADHIFVIPEDDADRQIAVGFVDHHSVRDSRIRVMPVAGGWLNVLRIFKEEYIQILRQNMKTHVVMLIDFDDNFADRRIHFENEIPDEVKPRVFVVGSRHEPETLRKAMNKSLEKIGESLASDCEAGTSAHWDHEQLAHNAPDRERLNQTVKPFLF